MADDFRVKPDFPDHRKTRRLIEKLGADSVRNLLRLWGYAATYRPKGILTDMTETDIEEEARWTGESGLFVKTCLEIGWLDNHKNGFFSLHDWDEHQRYIFYSPERKKAASRAAEERWRKHRSSNDLMRNGCDPHCDTHYDLHAEGNAPSPAPSPIPIPSPIPSPAPAPKYSADKPPKKSKEKKETDPDHAPFVKLYCDKYQEWFSRKYDFAAGKDAKHVSDILKFMRDGNQKTDWKNELTNMLEIFFSLPITEVGKDGHTLGSLYYQRHRLQELMHQ